jgi:uncharacterized protein DUF4231
MNESDVPEDVGRHPAWTRLQEQLDWYDKKSMANQRTYKWTKIAQITLASLIPLFSFLGTDFAKWLTAGAGALIAISEAVQQLGQYSALWITYRATAESLKHEKYLFLAAAGPYRDRPANERLALLAERVEERVSTEHAKWVSEAQSAIKQASNRPSG